MAEEIPNPPSERPDAGLTARFGRGALSRVAVARAASSASAAAGVPSTSMAFMRGLGVGAALVAIGVIAGVYVASRREAPPVNPQAGTVASASKPTASPASPAASSEEPKATAAAAPPKAAPSAAKPAAMAKITTSPEREPPKAAAETAALPQAASPAPAAPPKPAITAQEEKPPAAAAPANPAAAVALAPAQPPAEAAPARTVTEAITPNPPQIAYLPPGESESNAAAEFAAKSGRDHAASAALFPRGAKLPLPVRKPTKAIPPAPEPAASSAVAEAQRLLTSFGYEPDAANGRVGPRTLHAIRLFEQDAGLPIDGRVSDELLQFMRKLAGPSRPMPVATASAGSAPSLAASPPTTAPAAASALPPAPVSVPAATLPRPAAVPPPAAPPLASELAALEPLPVPKPSVGTALSQVASAAPAAPPPLPTFKPGRTDVPIQKGVASTASPSVPKAVPSKTFAAGVAMPSETSVESVTAAKPAAAPPQEAALSAPPPLPEPKPVASGPAKAAPPVAVTELAAVPPMTAKPLSQPPAAALAALPPTPVKAGSARAERAPSIRFAAGAADLSEEGKSELGKVAERLKGNEALRVQLYAYAAGSEAQTSQARFLSLTRALAVRDYLVSQGVNAERVDVRVLGNKLADKGPADRVDPVVIQR